MEQDRYKVSANIVDVIARKIFPATIEIEEGKIANIKKEEKNYVDYILPGFIDSHVHIESSMVTPVEFSRAAVMHGTIGIVSDPHEIANVLGIDGVRFMVENSRNTPLKILFGAPSCVPATEFETSGANITVKDINELFKLKEIGFLSEVMNYPGVINGDPVLMKKIMNAISRGYPVDGHAPGLRGKELKKYIEAGITTDHECFSFDEAKEKLNRGMKILIREGSGAKNFDTLIPLIKEYPDCIMFCSDDLHPDDLMEGHINNLVKRAIKKGLDLFDVLRSAGYNAVIHYGLNVGLLQVGDPADFVKVNSLEELKVLETYINGKKVFSKGKINIPYQEISPLNNFKAKTITSKDLTVSAEYDRVKVIQALDGELITRKTIKKLKPVDNLLHSDTNQDILKLVVLNRYKISNPSIGFINGFNLKKGAMASSIAHDSHNIICVGVTDHEIADTVNWVIKHKGGIAVNNGNKIVGLPLEIGGIISSSTANEAAIIYKKISSEVKKLGSSLHAPFMTLAFMALLVIPELKLSDRGLFDGNQFKYTGIFADE